MDTREPSTAGGSATARLRAPDERFRRAVENTDAGYFLIGLDGRYQDVNPAWLRMHGFTRREDAIGLHYSAVQTDEDRIRAEQVVAVLLRGESACGEFSRLRRDGAIGHHSFSANPVIEGGRVVAFEGFIIDTTESKRAKEELRASEERFRALAESAVVGIYVLQHGKYAYVNPAMATVFGYTVAEMIGMTPQDIVHPSHHAMVQENIRKRIAGEVRSMHYQVRGRYRDGSIRDVEVYGSTVQLNGRPALIGTLVDITARKRAEEALRDSEEKLATVFRSVPAAITVSDIESGFRVIDINDVFENIVGYARDEIVGRNVSELGIWLDPAEFSEAARQVREDGRLSNFEYRFRRKDGLVRTGLMSAEPVNLHGRACLVSATLDITERRQAEQAFRASTQQFVTIANCLPDVLWTMDLSGRFTYASPRVQQTHGWTPEELCKLTFADTTTPAQRMKSEQRLTEELIKASSRDYNRDSVITLESEELRKDGTTFWAEVNAALLWDDVSPVGLIGVTRDISERKRQENEKERLQNELAHAQRMELVGRLAGGIAHDFNNLLSVILINAESALEDIQSGESARDEAVAIRDAAKKGIALGQQLMAFSSKQVLQPENLNLNAVIVDSEKMICRLIGAHIKVEFRPDSGLGTVRADRGQIEQILMNMAVNSRDAMPEGGTFTIETVNVEVDQCNAEAYTGVQPGRYAKIAIRDTGIGMDEETLAHVFEPFFTTKPIGRGTGLGLSVVYGIVKQSDGFIRVESEPAHGTEFKIYLPVVPEMPQPALEAEDGPFEGGSETVLLVEDEAALREKLRQVLENAGYHVLVATNGKEAFRLGMENSGPIHLLLTDVVMPEMSGYSLAERLHALRPQTRILFMSGYPESAGGSLDLRSKDNFIQKPFTQKTLLRRMRDVLR